MQGLKSFPKSAFQKLMELECFTFFPLFRNVKLSQFLFQFTYNFEFHNPIVGCYRVHSRIANLASKYDCSNPYGFRDMAF